MYFTWHFSVWLFVVIFVWTLLCFDCICKEYTGEYMWYYLITWSDTLFIIAQYWVTIYTIFTSHSWLTCTWQAKRVFSSVHIIMEWSKSVFSCLCYKVVYIECMCVHFQAMEICRLLCFRGENFVWKYWQVGQIVLFVFETFALFEL